MCGIAGEVGSKPYIAPTEGVVILMAQMLKHRGPDELGHFAIQDRDWGVNLAVRRLAIIDREHGQQPMHCGRASVVFNGEIYNHDQLRNSELLRDEDWKTSCDTEAIAHLYDKCGYSQWQALDGMFAFAVWDRSRRALCLVRDRLGKKPLYYYWDEARNLLVFASEIKAILTHPNVPKKPNRAAIYQSLSLQYCPEPDTAFEGIKCVPPGGMVMYRPREGKLDVSKWWKLKPKSCEHWETRADMIKSASAAVQWAVLDRLESEVPLGVYLSGGIDSSIITAIASEQVDELHTFSMGFEESAYNELPYAKRVAEHFGTIHHEAMVRCPAMPEMAERIVEQYDQPFGDCSAIPTMLLTEASKKYITVALTGDGGDEAFGGYERYWACKAKAGIMAYAPWLCVIPPDVVEQLVTEEWYKSLNTKHTMAWLLETAMAHPGEGVYNQMMWLDIHTYLLNDIIVKMERASMASSVEARCPFLDHRVMELAAAIPGEMKVGDGFGKLILKEAFKDVLPTEVLLRPKRGFGVPVNEWFRRPEGQQMLSDMVSDTRWPWDIFRPKAIAGIIEAHLKGGNSAGHALWMFVILDLWMKKHFG